MPGARDRCDPRRSATYAAPAFGPRRIVFMLDTLSQNLCKQGGLERAKQTIIALLDTTSEEDLVALVLPSLEESASCLGEGFVRATEGNVRALQAIIRTLGTSSCGPENAGASYTEALEAAFDALEGTSKKNFEF